MPRRPAEPEYDDLLSYPARDAALQGDIGMLAKYLRAVAHSYEQAALAAAEEPAALETVEKWVYKGRTQAEQAHRLVTEYALASGQTQRTVAERLGIAQSTAYFFRHHPLSDGDLEPVSDNISTQPD